MFNSRLFLAALILLATTACNPFSRGRAVEMSAADPTLNTRWHANVASPATLSGVVQMRGSASMAPNGNETLMTLDLANASPGGLHPWGVHAGRCGTGGDDGVVGAGSAYEVMEVDGDGRAHGTANIAMQTPGTGDYFVVVYASQGNRSTVVACGNLAAPTR